MSGETEKDISGWTTDTLHEHMVTMLQRMHEEIDRRFDSQKEAVDAAFAASEKAIVKGETATEKRFQSVNEFRQQLNDQSRTFVTRTEVDSKFKSLQDKQDVARDLSAERLADLQQAIRRVEGLTQEGMNRIELQMRERFATDTGRTTGISSLWGVIIGAVGFVATCVVVVVALVSLTGR